MNGQAAHKIVFFPEPQPFEDLSRVMDATRCASHTDTIRTLIAFGAKTLEPRQAGAQMFYRYPDGREVHVDCTDLPVSPIAPD